MSSKHGHGESESGHEHGGFINRMLGGRAELIFALLCGALLLI
ncbi:hypothetical protein MNBD_ALPHA04-1397, partial [hydrothermal vent metagenome]